MGVAGELWAGGGSGDGGNTGGDGYALDFAGGGECACGDRSSLGREAGATLGVERIGDSGCGGGDRDEDGAAVRVVLFYGSSRANVVGGSAAGGAVFMVCGDQQFSAGGAGLSAVGKRAK